MMRHLSEGERRRRCQNFLASVTAVKSTREKEPCSAPQIADSSLKLLTKAGLEPGLPLLQMYNSLDFHPAEGRSAMDDLQARGYVRSHRLVRRGRGGQPIVVEVLAPGRHELERRGIAHAVRLIARGGFKHDCYARWLRWWAKAQGYVHWFERLLGVKAFDFVYEAENGSLHGIEIALTGSVRLNAEQAIKAASVPGVIDVVIACEGRAMLKRIENQTNKIDELGLYRDKILYSPLAEYSPW